MMNYARAAAALIAAFVDPYSAAVRSRATFTAKQPQSESSKAFYRSRAEQKRARRAARMTHLAGIGAIGTVLKPVEQPSVETPTKVRKSRAKKIDA